MSASPPPIPGHFAIEKLYGEVLVALESRETVRLLSLWETFEAALSAHFEGEEQTSIADLLVARPREARIILEEHRYLRGRLAELRSALPALPLGPARTFLDELRAHGDHEERVLYRWAEANAVTKVEKPAV